MIGFNKVKKSNALVKKISDLLFYYVFNFIDGLYYWKFETREPFKNSGWLGPYEEPVISQAFNIELEYLVTLRIVDGMGLENQVTRPVMIQCRLVKEIS